jgi:predicted RNase H-related nuclease YkuK (DUF458 family)
MKIFRKIDGTKITDVVRYTLDMMSQHPELKIHVGTDSQNVEDTTVYVSVIAYHIGNNGVHYIYYKEKVPRINDMWTRLWKEAEKTIEIAQWFTQKANSIKLELDLDYNDDKFAGSNQLVPATKGWAESLGYKTHIKPEVCVAIRAADYHCR